MTFDNQEKSQYRGMPVELYMFRYGTEKIAFYAYTNAEYDIQYQNINFRAVPIQRKNYKVTGSLDKATMKITTSRDMDLFNLFRYYPPTQPVIATIYQGHLEDPDHEFPVVWTGRILSAARKENTAVFTCEPTVRALKRAGLRRNYQFSCPHVLYGPLCQANQNNATLKIRIITRTETRLTFAHDWTIHPVSKYIGGLVHWPGKYGLERRTVIRVNNGSQLSLSGPATGLKDGDYVSVAMGCNHQMTDCQNLHGNILNFGGQPWIPLKNPINKPMNQ